MSTLLIRNAQLVNEGKIKQADVLCKGDRIERISPTISGNADTVIDARGCYLLPGVIDDQVHFREPGFPHKADIASESRTAVAGGVTSFMEMPNTNPTTTTAEKLDEKMAIAAKVSPANYSFFFGATNDNYDEVMRVDTASVCGVKAFMGSSTGNMLVDNPTTLEKLFSNSPTLIATHCEDEATVRANVEKIKAEYEGRLDQVPASIHPIIRNEEACVKSSQLAMELARKHNTRLHILHITTEDEAVQFTAGGDLREKRITSEACVHHLWFTADDYERLGHQVKCNPAIKASHHREALRNALRDDRLDVVATDHAPHTWDEKQQAYFEAPAGLPLVQHSLLVMWQLYREGYLTLTDIPRKMSHALAESFRMVDRGYIREGYFADFVIVDGDGTTTVSKENIVSKCGWSPFEGTTFPARVTHTIVNGQIVYDGEVKDIAAGQRLTFEAER